MPFVVHGPAHVPRQCPPLQFKGFAQSVSRKLLCPRSQTPPPHTHTAHWTSPMLKKVSRNVQTPGPSDVLSCSAWETWRGVELRGPAPGGDCGARGRVGGAGGTTAEPFGACDFLLISYCSWAK